MDGPRGEKEDLVAIFMESAWGRGAPPGWQRLLLLLLQPPGWHRLQRRLGQQRDKLPHSYVKFDADDDTDDDGGGDVKADDDNEIAHWINTPNIYKYVILYVNIWWNYFIFNEKKNIIC